VQRGCAEAGGWRLERLGFAWICALMARWTFGRLARSAALVGLR
jgi:hypothetical protein